MDTNIEKVDRADRAEAAKETRDGQKPFRPRKKKKVCFFCAEKIEHIDYKNVGSFRKNLSERSKILPRRITGTCAKHQRQLTIAVKRARELALVPYISD
jgi:small subunit ribosomal protein S18